MWLRDWMIQDLLAMTAEQEMDVADILKHQQDDDIIQIV
jgi:hypothetical protein